MVGRDRPERVAYTGLAVLVTIEAAVFEPQYCPRTFRCDEVRAFWIYELV